MDVLDRVGVAAYKIASPDLANPILLEAVGARGRPVILSTGMADLAEVEAAVVTLRRAGAQSLVLLHCTSAYPAPAEEANLRAMATLREAFDVPVGFSDHTVGDAVALAAVALGACVLEKHFTLDRSLPGPDHRASLEPDELAQLVRRVRTVEAALGDGVKRPSPAERREHCGGPPEPRRRHRSPRRDRARAGDARRAPARHRHPGRAPGRRGRAETRASRRRTRASRSGRSRMKRVGVVTVGRSDYGIYRPLLRELAGRGGIDVQLYVGGMHLRERFGSTVEEIEADGFPIAARVDFLEDDDSPLAVAEAIGRGVTAFARAFADGAPDLLVVLGDRFEMLAAGLAALPLTIPVAHLHGGESTEGAIDESMRHALTKLSHLHFASMDAYAHRIVQLGEEPWRVVTSGALALDAIRVHAPVDDARLAERGVHLRGPTLLVTFHPVTLESSDTDRQIDAVLEAVDGTGLDAVLTYPNADAHHGAIVERLERLAGDERFTLVRNLGPEAYYTLLGRAVAMVGNSSSGIIEAASFRLPVVDVGDRQRGRLRPANVLHVAPDANEIAQALEAACSERFRAGLAELENPYGDGHAAPRIADVLESTPLDDRLLVKRFHDL